MPDFYFRGQVELNGVEFRIKARSMKAAKEKAELGEYDDYDTSAAEAVNWLINPKTGEKDE